MTVTEPTPQPGLRSFAPHVYYSATKGLCATCHTPVDAKIQFLNDSVLLDKFCPSHGKQQCVVSSSVEWYLDALAFLAPSDPPARAAFALSAGCPFDCGPCASHAQRLTIPANPRDDAGTTSTADAGETSLVRAPWEYPSTEEARRWIAELCASPVAASLTIELGPGARRRSLRPPPPPHPSPSSPPAAGPARPVPMTDMRGDRTAPRLAVSGMLAVLERASAGRIHWLDFVPSPEAHPHCFSLGDVLVLDDRSIVPLARLVGRDVVFALHRNGLTLAPDAPLATALAGVPRELPQMLRPLEAPIREVLDQIKQGCSRSEEDGPARAQEFIRRHVKTIIVHAFMDAQDFDVSRVIRCPVGYAAADGTSVPVCAQHVVFDHPSPEVSRLLALRKRIHATDEAASHSQ